MILEESIYQEFLSLLQTAGIEIEKYSGSTIPKPIKISEERSWISLTAFLARLRSLRISVMMDHKKAMVACEDNRSLHELLSRYDREKRMRAAEEAVKNEPSLPPGFLKAQLNVDVTHQGRDIQYFLTDRDTDKTMENSGALYVRLLGLKEQEALAMARFVVPVYEPRQKGGVRRHANYDGRENDFLNVYVPPSWTEYEGDLPNELPMLFEKLVHHLFPLEIEREYLFDWIYKSLTSRSYVYLVLCGKPGTGKNRLQLVLRALHGTLNSVAGKRSSFAERFNSQMADCTLLWFDELKYNREMENIMKEMQNDSISIERKGVDATRSTKLHASSVISNNEPRDNYLAFDARKFAPLVITSKRLEASMTAEEIKTLTEKVNDPKESTFDLPFVTQIGRWILNRGYSGRWPHLEYRGPMFYRLAHTSMPRWQKLAVNSILKDEFKDSGSVIIDPDKGYLWSTVEHRLTKRNTDKHFPDFSSVQYFFDTFADGNGVKAFKTTSEDDILGDFWVKLINKDVRIMSEREVLSDIGDEEFEVRAEDVL